MRKLSEYLKPFVPFMVLVVAVLFMQAFCDLSLPNLMSHLVNGIVSQGSQGSQGSAGTQPPTGTLPPSGVVPLLGNSLLANGTIVNLGLEMLGIALLGGLAAVGVAFLSTRIAAGIARNLRLAVFQKVESFSSHEFDTFSTASLITRCTNDITQVQQLFVNGIRMVCYAPIMGIGGIIMAVRKAPAMSWIIALAVIVLIGMISILISIVMPKFRIIQNLVDRLNRIARETLNGLMVIRAFSAQNHETKRFDGVNKELAGVNLFVNRVMVLQQPGMQFIQNTAILFIIWIGAHRIAASTMQIGDMMAFIQYTMQIIQSFNFFSMMMVMIPRTAVSADRISKVLETEVSIRDPAPKNGLIKSGPGIGVPGKFPGGKVEFKNVSFRYEGAVNDVLSNLNFSAETGEITAIIGPTGSGKSTILNLILRFYDITGGSISVDGTDIREITQNDLRMKIGYVPQKSVLLSGPISFNLRYGKENASDTEIREGAEIAQAMDFIKERPDGFESNLSQGGSNVSGGQKQRLAIARALVKEPEILIFDDSFSALDFATDARLRQAIEEKRKGITKIIVAQRVGTIMHADKIIVLEKGKITGMGTHDELMESCAEYREIAESQFAEDTAV